MKTDETMWADDVCFYVCDGKLRLMFSIKPGMFFIFVIKYLILLQRCLSLNPNLNILLFFVCFYH